MVYNVIYNRQMSVGPTYLFALEDKMLKELIDSYNHGNKTFFYRGKTEYIIDITKIEIFNTNELDNNLSPSKLHESLQSRLQQNYHSPAAVRNLFLEIGKNVTEDFIKGSYGYLAEKSAIKVIDSSKVKEEYVNKIRIDELRAIKSDFDLCKLIRLCEELNSNFQNKNYFSVGALVRAIIDHVPPAFECKTFTEVANSYASKGDTKSFKESMLHLDNSMKKISDSFLHSQIRYSETLPNETSVDCKKEIDKLLGELCRILK